MYLNESYFTAGCNWECFVNGKLPQRKFNVIKVIFSWTVAQYIDLNMLQQTSVC